MPFCVQSRKIADSGYGSMEMEGWKAGQQAELGERILEAKSLEEIEQWLKSVCHNLSGKIGTDAILRYDRLRVRSK